MQVWMAILILKELMGGCPKCWSGIQVGDRLMGIMMSW
jgi:hypothetical protein